MLAGVATAPSAWAQCTDNFNVALFANGQFKRRKTPFRSGKGASIPAFLSTINTVNTAFLTQTTAFVSAPGNPAPDQQGSGVWSRVIAGTVDTDSTAPVGWT